MEIGVQFTSSKCFINLSPLQSQVRDAGAPGWNIPHTSASYGCSDCFSFSVEDLCSHETSDHNYFGVCQVSIPAAPFISNILELKVFNFWTVFFETIAIKMKSISGDPRAQRLLPGHSPGIVAHHPRGRQGQVPLVAEVVGRMRDTVQSGWTFRGSCPTSWDSQTNLIFYSYSSF